MLFCCLVQYQRDGIDLQRKIKELNSFLEAAKAQQQEDHKQMQAIMEKLLAKEDRMEKELVKLKDALGKAVSYLDFSKLADKVRCCRETALSLIVIKNSHNVYGYLSRSRH